MILLLSAVRSSHSDRRHQSVGIVLSRRDRGGSEPAPWELFTALALTLKQFVGSESQVNLLFAVSSCSGTSYFPDSCPCRRLRAPRTCGLCRTTGQKGLQFKGFHCLMSVYVPAVPVCRGVVLMRLSSSETKQLLFPP